MRYSEKFFEKRKTFIVLIIAFFVLFILLRLPSIVNKTFPYTYDQGRDFLKAEEIIRYKNPTFIGPTTGIMGLYHGAWWYYYLSLPYLFADGNPLFFPVWTMSILLLSSLLFAFFLRKEFGNIPALLFFSLITLSGYFINMSVFVISSTLTFPFILGFIYSLYNLFKRKERRFIFLTFMFAGFIWEAEFPFGVFLIPSLLISLILLEKGREILFKRKHLLAAFAGFIIPFLPRIAFEMKNNFIQTKTLINFLLKPKLHNPKPLVESFAERALQFKNFYLQSFPEIGKEIYGLIFLGLIIYTIYLLFKKKKKDSAYSLLFKVLALLLFFLFFLSGFYRDNFWGNYYEGIQIFFIALSILSVKIIWDQKIKIFYSLIPVLTFLVLLTSAPILYQRLTSSPGKTGFFIQEYYVKKLYQENKGKDFCLRIYTPPVIPYTYEYLLKYYSRKLATPEPQSDFVENKCYFLIEDEAPGFEFRIKDWRKKNIPADSKLIKKDYKYGVTLELRETKK